MPEEVRFFGRLSLYAVAAGLVYWFVSYETAGTVLLLGFGIATGVAFLALRGSRRRPDDGARDEQARVPDGPFGDESAPVPTRSAAPLAVGFGIAVIGLAGAFGPWFAIAGAVPLLVGRRRLAARRQPRAGPADARGRRHRPGRRPRACRDRPLLIGAHAHDASPRSRDDGGMQHADHVALIRDGVAGAGPRWLELGSGDGEFTLALADLLGETGHILALDRDQWALGELAARAGERFPGTRVHTVVADFRHGLPAGPFDGVLAANSLHFVADPTPVLLAIHSALGEGGRLVLVEYDADHGNPYVPHPISFRRWQQLAPDAGFAAPYLLHRVPSRFLGAIYGAVAARLA